MSPILPDIQKKLEQYATNLENFSIYEYEKSQIHWERSVNPSELLNFEESPICTTLKVQRDPFTGEIVDFHEVPVKAPGRSTSVLSNAPIFFNNGTGDGEGFNPFHSSGISSGTLDLPKFEEVPASELLTMPPGFSCGLSFDADGVSVLKKEEISAIHRGIPEQKHVINLLELAQREQDVLGKWGSNKTEPEDTAEVVQNQQQLEEEAVIPKEPLVLNISQAAPLSASRNTEWAVVLDSTKPVKDFDERIPNKALEFPYELDNFQKLAILKLEQHEHVFVAAHTSAGKTAVAEYAIALSQKHLTKTIYTSPIKALSNQKYRDFKKKFKDVGLITGDFKIDETARCLIMTTEILKSMLYSNSETIRDLEYVIFDEVHYINDKERGHVWEQVLILLPKHVCIVLLSATVPKPEKFADWLGRIHEKKVYVVTTYERPVPLQHFLYTGTDGKTKDNRFLILNKDKWCMEGYFQAKNAIPDQKRGSDRRQFTEKQDKTLWSALISHFQKNDLLPALAFTFSRAKCDRNANNLSSINLTTEEEKSRIRIFYEKCIRKLKEVDRDIPQVIYMKDILLRGIGVHHSGILPIIKEIVEMLFEARLIKLLFATETFAMGVNTPARTVVYDSITKHDGNTWRELEPAEYIQMAGRAGRRGIDKKGTVIILCKNNLPPELTLKKMMMGQPQTLESQFKLTYSMVLNLLRVERVSVEKMMYLSFLEADQQVRIGEWKKELAEVEKEISEMCNEELSSHLHRLVEYFDCANTYLKFRHEILSNVLCHGKVLKVLTPGRVLLISWKNHINKLAMLVSIAKTGKLYKVLILTDKNQQSCKLDTKTDLWYKMISLASEKVYCPPDGVLGHDIVEIEPDDVLEITGRVIKVDTELVYKDWNNRQLERFKYDPPGQSTFKAIQELHKLSLAAPSSETLEFLHFLFDIHVDDSVLYEDLQEMYILKKKLEDQLSKSQNPNFLELFSIVFSKKYLEEKRAHLKYLLSKDNLKLYSGYESRIKLLKDKRYIDDNNVVQMKGRVACQMGMNELLITELMLDNVFDELTPAEVAALLSTLVFQVRSRKQDEGESKLLEGATPALLKAIEKLEKIHREIITLEARQQIRSDDIQDELNYGVVMIVYNWASKKSFAEIMQYTEYQEGIIVRCIQQLNDTICDLRDAAKIIGNPTIQKKMDDASKAIERDIVNVASLYTQKESSFLK